jgi:hypothetical protein
MPAFWHRWHLRADGIQGLERGIPKFCGIGPVRETFIGLMEGSDAVRRRWQVRMERLGRAGA